MMDRMHRPLRAGWFLLVLLLIPGTGEAQVVVTEESLASTTDAGLAYARAGIATAGLKLAAAEAERLAAEARTADSITRANRAASATAPTAAGTPRAGQTVDATPSSAGSTTPAPATAPAPAATSTPPAQSTATTTPPSGPVTEILRARTAQQSGSTVADGVQETGAPEAALPDAPLADDHAPVTIAGLIEEAPAAAAAMETAPVQTDPAAGTPALDGRDSPLPDAFDLGNWTTGIASAASVRATRWATLFSEAADQHPGLMPALLLLMAASATTVLAVGAGIRPWRRSRAAHAATRGEGLEGGEPPRPHRMRHEARVPRDVEAVLASLELRTGRPLRAPHPVDPQESVAPVTRRQA